MITTALVLATLLQSKLPDNPSFDYSGLPQLRTPERVDIISHSVTCEIDGTREGFVDVTSTTVFKNMTKASIKATLVVPRRRYGDANSSFPNFDITGTWDLKKLILTPASDHGYQEANGKVVKYATDLSAPVRLMPGGTYGLRLSYTVPIGKCGYEQKQKIVGYLFDGDKTIGQLNVTYRYGGKTVFSLPEARPNLGWQVGEKGAFVRQENYWPDNQLTYVTFYPGGFEG
jgi:hypothetical protein